MSDHPTGPPPEPGAWKAAFLAALRASPNVAAAAKASGVNRQYCYEARGLDAEFAAAWDEAKESVLDDLEAEVFRRARKGTRRPVFYKGSQCGTVREFSDTLAMFVLRSHRGEVYRDKVSAEHSGEVKVTVRYADELDAIAGGGDRPQEAPPGPGPDPPVEGPV